MVNPLFSLAICLYLATLLTQMQGKWWGSYGSPLLCTPTRHGARIEITRSTIENHIGGRQAPQVRHVCRGRSATVGRDTNWNKRWTTSRVLLEGGGLS